MATGVALIAGQPIVNRGARKVVHHADGFEGLASSFWVGGIMGEVIRRADMHPVRRLANTQSRFILVNDGGLDQGGFDLRFHLGQLPMTDSHKRRNAPCRELDPQQILQELTAASIGDRLPFHQIHS